MRAEDKLPICGLSVQELRDWCDGAGVEDYRASQIWRWLYVQGVTAWDAMSNVPLKLREALQNDLLLRSATCEKESGEAGRTRKLLLKLRDDEFIETVLIPARGRLTVCLSSQVGCRYKCSFCASGQSGFTRNLDAGEIVEQIMIASDVGGENPTHVVLMGIGEPFDNYEEVMKAVRIINDGDGLKIGARRITISTCGVVEGIERLAGENLQVELSVSLHAANDELRDSLVPVNRKYPLTKLIAACSAYTKKTGRIITFEYTMIDGVNDSREHASELVGLLKPLSCRANLIPLSSVAEYSGRSSSEAACQAFMDVLRRSGINTTIRRSQGGSYRAACGQLRSGRNSGA